jgi:hypothetical protein
LSVDTEKGAATETSPMEEQGKRIDFSDVLQGAKSVLLSSLFLGVVLTILTWPLGGIGPTPGLDPSWVAGLYMAGERGLQAGTEIAFTYGPLGFLGLPNLFDIEMGRIAFLWVTLSQIALCTGLIWSTRRAFGVIVAVPLTFVAVSITNADPLLIAATVLCAAGLFGEWSLRSKLAFAVGIGVLSGIELLGSLRAGPTLLVMGFATLLGLPDRRRTMPAFFATVVVSFFLFWFVTGQGLGNLGDYIVNTGEVVSGYSASMVFYTPGPWWEDWAIAVSAITVAVFCLVIAWGMKGDMLRRLGFVLMVAAVTFLMFKHAVVRESAGSAAVFVSASFGISLALVPYTRRWLAVVPVVIFLAFTYIANNDHLSQSFDYKMRSSNLQAQLEEIALPGHAKEGQELGRESMKATYGLSPADVSLLRSGTVHVAPWEAGVIWAYKFHWAPLPVFQQYSAYTEGLDKLNAAKLESSTAPDFILWENTTVYDPNSINYPGTIDARWPAFESPAEMVQMFCRYRTVRWDNHWAILRRAPDRCGPPRPLETIETANGEAVRMPRTRRNEALLVSVHGLAIEGLGDRLRTMLLHAQNRHVIFSSALWNIVGDTAADGLLLRVPRWADYPGKFALDSESSTVGFEKIPGFLTGVDDSTRLKLHFYAIPLDASAMARHPRAAAQKR